MTGAVRRHLAAVMFTDIAGYTALMQRDEEAAVGARARHRAALEGALATHDGQLLQYLGDGSLSIFPSAIEAVRAAIDVQRDLATDPPVELRIGIHQGDIARDEQGIYGDSVNVASRLQNLAPAGGILISEKVYDEIKNQKALPAIFLGEVALKNVQKAVAVYAVSAPGIRVPVRDEPALSSPAVVPVPLKGGPTRETGPAPAPPSLRVRPRVRAQSRAALSGGVLVLVVAAAVVVVRFQRQNAAADVAAETLDVIAVLPATVRGSDAPPGLGSGLALMLSPALDALDNVRSVDANALISFAERRPPVDVRLGARAAHEFQANRFLLSNVFIFPDRRLDITASLYADDGVQLGTAIQVQGSLDGLPVLITDLMAKLIASLARPGQERLIGEPICKTPSTAALINCIQGEEALRRSQNERAVEVLRQAVSEDSAFAWANYRLSQAHEWTFDFIEAHQAARRALRLAESRVPLQLHRQIAAWSYFLHGQPDEAERLYNALLSSREDAEARSGIGEVLMHYNPVRGLSSAAAIPHFRSVLNVDHAGLGEARHHLLEWAARRRDRAAFDSLFAQLDATGDQYLVWQTVRAFAWGDTQEQERLSARIESGGERLLGLTAARIAANLRDFPGAERLARRLTTPEHPRDWQAVGQILLGQLALAQGRWADGFEILHDAAALEQHWSRELLALFHVVPFVAIPESDLRALRQNLEDWNPVATSPSPSFFFLAHAEIHRQIRLYLLGLLSVRMGNLADAEEWRRQLQRSGGGEETTNVAVALAQSLYGHMAFAADDPKRAIERFDAVRLTATVEQVGVSPILSRVLDRYVRAAALVQLEQPDSAVRWLISITDGIGDFAFFAPAHLRLAEILAASGDAEQAAFHAREAAKFWPDAALKERVVGVR